MGGFTKKTIRDVEVKGKRVLLRADYNVPLVGGKVSEAYRLSQSLPTIKYLLDQGADGIVLVSHLGRPNGQFAKSMSLAPVATALSDMLGKKVGFANDSVGDDAQAKVSKLKPGQILMLENLRFHPGEEANDADFAKQLIKTTSAELFVQDGFGVVHRKNASTDAITKLLPSVAGLLVEKEVATLTDAINNPKHPLTAIIGGAKISDKIEFINQFIKLADCVAIGGAMANTFLLAQGVRVGASLAEKDSTSQAKQIMRLAAEENQNRPFVFLLPQDLVVSESADGTQPTRVVDISDNLADIQSYPRRPKAKSYEVSASEKILDIGPASAARIAGAVQMSQMVIWNGTLGITETKPLIGGVGPFERGTKQVVQAMIGTGKKDKAKPKSIVGGGDTSSYLEQEGLISEFDFVSTGGGAALELLSGKKLPGVEALADKN